MAAVPAEWKNTPYAHEANNRALRGFLQDFAHTVGLQLHIDGTLPGVVNGKLRADTLTALMERLALEHRFQWFVHNNTLYISSLSQQTSARLEVADDTIADLKQALSQIGLLDERFGWGELPDIGVVLVSGPKRYIEQIRQFSRKRAEPANKQDVLNFTLQFANAADRQIDYRGEKLSIPEELTHYLPAQPGNHWLRIAHLGTDELWLPVVRASPAVQPACAYESG